MAEVFKISGARINKLYGEIDDIIDKFIIKNPKTTNEEMHVALHRIYQVRELQPIIQLTTMWQKDVDRDTKTEYIQ